MFQRKAPSGGSEQAIAQIRASHHRLPSDGGFPVSFDQGQPTVLPGQTVLRHLQLYCVIPHMHL